MSDFRSFTNFGSQHWHKDRRLPPDGSIKVKPVVCKTNFHTCSQVYPGYKSNTPADAGVPANNRHVSLGKRGLRGGLRGKTLNNDCHNEQETPCGKGESSWQIWKVESQILGCCRYYYQPISSR